MKRNPVLLLIPVLICLFPKFIQGQVTAAFTVSDSIGCNPLTVNFTNTGSSGADYSYEWFFGSLPASSLENPSVTFNNAGNYEVTQIITNTNTSETDTSRKTITVILTPSANLTSIDSANSCIGGNIVFRTGFASKDSARWDFGDGISTNNIASFVTHSYDSQGTYSIQYITYYQTCSDTSEYKITIDNQKADFSIIPDAACKGAPVMFVLGDTTDVQSFFWNTGENGVVLNGDQAIYSYETMGLIYPNITITGLSGECTLVDTIEIFQIAADFTFGEDQLCDGQTVVFFNSSVGDDFSYWDLGNGTISSAENPSATYTPGEYTITLKVESSDGCLDSTQTSITINSPPTLQVVQPPDACPGETVSMSASGGHQIRWSPPAEFNDPASYTPTVSPDSTTIYSLIITDTLTHCSASGEVTVHVQEGFILGKITVFPADTAIYSGDTIFVSFIDTLSRTLGYRWLPDIQISCTDCPEPFMIPLETTTYTLEVSDENQCAISEDFQVVAEVTQAYRFGLPEAFTPNEDGTNDILKVNGVGIKQLLEFRIFNRWGTEVFFSDDINRGWDGSYKGNPQPIDSYVYTIRAEMWNGNIAEEKGTFSLLR